MSLVRVSAVNLSIIIKYPTSRLKKEYIKGSDLKITHLSVKLIPKNNHFNILTDLARINLAHFQHFITVPTQVFF